MVLLNSIIMILVKEIHHYYHAILECPPPGAGLEPATLPLTAGCSTIELPGRRSLPRRLSRIVENNSERDQGRSSMPTHCVESPGQDPLCAKPIVIEITWVHWASIFSRS